LLLIINFPFYAGCIIFKSDGTEVDLNQESGPVYVQMRELSDNDFPQTIYTCRTEGIAGFERGMEHCYKKE
jgi:hypothetical protein